MICLRVRRLLPQYCSGELPERARQRVQEHLDECVQCSAERALFEDALAAIAAGAPMLETPPELEFLRLPEEAVKGRTFWRPALAAALASTAALALVLPSVRLGNDPGELNRTPPAVELPKATIPEKPPVVAAGTEEPVRVHPPRLANVQWRQRPRESAAKAGSSRVVAVKPDVVPAAEPERPAIVVVSNPVKSSGVEIESFDIDTGEQSYFRSEPDGSGGQQVVEVSWSPAADVTAEGDEL